MNRDMVGFAYPPSEPYLVTEKSIQDFARALGDDNPAFFDAVVARELGHETICAPPTFPILITMEAMKDAFADPALNMDFTRVVHGDQRFAYQRPIRVGDELVVVTHVDEIRSLGNNDAATFRTEVTSNGEPVCTGWSKLIVRGEA
jgi:acyl dehydratase